MKFVIIKFSVLMNKPGKEKLTVEYLAFAQYFLFGNVI